MIFLILFFFVILIILAIPVWIAEKRGLNEAHQGLVLMASLIGLAIPVVWIFALLFSCFIPKTNKQ